MADADMIVEGRQLLAAATPGQWWPTEFGDIFAGDGTEGPDGASTVADNVSSPDRHLITHMHNGYGQLLDELEQARARIAELEGERVADGFGIQSLIAEDGVATLATVPTTEEARELVLAMSLACGQLLDEAEAQNYIEFEASPANRPGYIVHVRRAAGPSPHMLRRDAEARAERAEARIDRVTDLFDAWAAEGNEHRLAGQLGIAEGLHVAIEALKEAIHG